MQKIALLASIRRVPVAYGSTAAASFSHTYAALSRHRVINKLGLTRQKRDGAWVKRSFAKSMPSLLSESVCTGSKIKLWDFVMDNNGLNGNRRFN
jgi:hypothetical protein